METHSNGFIGDIHQPRLGIIQNPIRYLAIRNLYANYNRNFKY